MFNLKKTLRPHILNLRPYSSARDEYSGSEGIFLDANENPLGSITQQEFNRYPDPYQWKLKEKIAAIKNVPKENIFLGNGSDEAIDLLYRAFCSPDTDNVIIMPPTYGMYEVSASINDVFVKKVQLSADFQMNLEKVQSAIDENTKLIFVCTPNNPTANDLDHQTVLALIQGFSGIVVVDEAYIDFSSQPSFTQHLSEYPNLVVLQTFSKAWGLASLRLGLAYASEDIIRIFNKIKPPYNISGLTQEKVLEALDNVEKKNVMVEEILAQRKGLAQAFEQIEAVRKVYPSDANFLLVKIDHAREVYNYLVDNRIIVRDRSNVVLCDNCLRITVGNAQENEILIQKIKDFKK
jgi:histidinol-phosphate aminotransferase